MLAPIQNSLKRKTNALFFKNFSSGLASPLSPVLLNDSNTPNAMGYSHPPVLHASK